MNIGHLHNILTRPCSAGRPPVASFEDWVGVLHLATMWEFKLVSFPELHFMICAHTIVSYHLAPRDGDRGPFRYGD